MQCIHKSQGLGCEHFGGPFFCSPQSSTVGNYKDEILCCFWGLKFCFRQFWTRSAFSHRAGTFWRSDKLLASVCTRKNYFWSFRNYKRKEAHRAAPLNTNDGAYEMSPGDTDSSPLKSFPSGSSKTVPNSHFLMMMLKDIFYPKKSKLNMVK